VVTDDELWILPHFPFSAFAGRCDLDHRIARDAIKSIEKSGRKVTVEFATEEFQTRKVELRLRNPDGFLAAIESDTPISSTADRTQ
jgi:hypothetical protein